MTLYACAASHAAGFSCACSFALAMVNNGNKTAEIACDAACFTALLDGAKPVAKYAVTDLWSKEVETVEVITSSPTAAVAAEDGDGVGFSYSASVGPRGLSRIFKVTEA